MSGVTKLYVDPVYASLPQMVNGQKVEMGINFVDTSYAKYPHTGGYSNPVKIYYRSPTNFEALCPDPYIETTFTSNPIYKITTTGDALYGVPAVSSNNYYQIHAQYIPSTGGYWQRGTFEFTTDRKYVGFVPDSYAVGMNSQGLLVDSNVVASAAPVLYIKAAHTLPQLSDLALSAVQDPTVVIDSGLILGVKNLTTTVDTSTFAIGRLANGVATATVHLNNIKDVGQEILSLKADAQLFPDIYAATSSNGTLTLISNGHATLAEWQAALRAVTYQDNAASPTTGVRTVTFDFNDGSHASYASNQDYVVVTGSGSSSLLRAAVEPNDPNSTVMVAFDTGSGQNAGEAYRLYRAFDRAPDLGGVGYWIGKLDTGTNLKDLAKGFLDSAEFQNLYGTNITDDRFVTSLYSNFFHRTPDQVGQDYWLAALKSGVNRAEVLIGFSESPESISQTAPLVLAGINYQPV